MPLYTEVADRILTLIEDGSLHLGDRIPSIRDLSRRFKVSANTVKEAYFLLESQRFIEAKPQSGYFVRRRVPPAPSGPPEPPVNLDPTQVSLCRVYGEINRQRRLPGSSLAMALPDSKLLPARKLNEYFQGAWKTLGHDLMTYEMPPGLPLLREQIALRMTDAGVMVSPDDVIITSGCSEAISLALLCLCRPGDTIAVESPTYFNFLNLLLELGIKVLEIPTTAQVGLNLDVLEFALDHHDIKAVLAIPNFSNPLGSLMPEPHKQRLVELCARRAVPLIEDDLYGDLAAVSPRPWACKAYDQTGNVIYCSSFSKTLAPGYRIGWIIPGNWRARVDNLKSLLSVASPTPTQWAVARFLEGGGYDRHLRQLRQALASQTGALAEAVARSFPPGTRVSRPAGGFVLWVEMAPDFDSLKLYETALAEGILISPGVIFSATERLNHCLRLSAGVWNSEVEAAISRLGQLAHDQASRTAG